MDSKRSKLVDTEPVTSNYFAILPKDILKIILRQIDDYRDLISLEISCKVLYEAIRPDNWLWFQAYKRALCTFTNDEIAISDDEYLSSTSEDQDDTNEKEEDTEIDEQEDHSDEFYYYQDISNVERDLRDDFEFDIWQGLTELVPNSNQAQSKLQDLIPIDKFGPYAALYQDELFTPFKDNIIDDDDTDDDSDIETLLFDDKIDWREEIKRDYSMVCKKALLLSSCCATGRANDINKTNCFCDDIESLGLTQPTTDIVQDKFKSLEPDTISSPTEFTPLETVTDPFIFEIIDLIGTNAYLRIFMQCLHAISIDHSSLDCQHWREVLNYRYHFGDIPFTNAIKVMTIQQIQHAKKHWNSTNYAESVRNTLCALNKLHRTVLFSLESQLLEKYPVLTKRHTVFDVSEALENHTEDVHQEADHWPFWFHTTEKGETASDAHEIHTAMHKIIRRAGVLKSEPDTCETGIQVLKGYIQDILKTVVEQKGNSDNIVTVEDILKALELGKKPHRLYTTHSIQTNDTFSAEPYYSESEEDESDLVEEPLAEVKSYKPHYASITTELSYFQYPEIPDESKDEPLTNVIIKASKEAHEELNCENFELESALCPNRVTNHNKSEDYRHIKDTFELDEIVDFSEENSADELDSSGPDADPQTRAIDEAKEDIKVFGNPTVYAEWPQDPLQYLIKVKTDQALKQSFEEENRLRVLNKYSNIHISTKQPNLEHLLEKIENNDVTILAFHFSNENQSEQIERLVESLSINTSIIMIELSNLNHISLKQFADLLGSCKSPDFKKLLLVESSVLPSDESIIFPTLPIQTLQIAQFEGFAAIKSILANSPSLTEFSIADIVITHEEFEEMLESISPTLKQLNITSIGARYPLFHKLARFNLESLVLNDISVKSEHLADCLKGSGSLKSIDVANCPTIALAPLIKIVNTLPNLETLNMNVYFPQEIAITEAIAFLFEECTSERKKVKITFRAVEFNSWGGPTNLHDQAVVNRRKHLEKLAEFGVLFDLYGFWWH